MTVNGLKALSYITSVAAEEWPILYWIAVLNTIYTDGIPEETTMASAINYYAEKFPDFEKRAEQNDQKQYDALYDEFLKFIDSHLENNK